MQESDQLAQPARTCARPNSESPGAAFDIFHRRTESKLWALHQRAGCTIQKRIRLDTPTFPSSDLHLGLASVFVLLLVLLVFLFFLVLALLGRALVAVGLVLVLCGFAFLHSVLLLDHALHFVLQVVRGPGCDPPASGKKNHVTVCLLQLRDVWIPSSWPGPSFPGAKQESRPFKFAMPLALSPSSAQCADCTVQSRAEKPASSRAPLGIVPACTNIGSCRVHFVFRVSGFSFQSVRELWKQLSAFIIGACLSLIFGSDSKAIYAALHTAFCRSIIKN